jgi:O-antigen ligase
LISTLTNLIIPGFFILIIPGLVSGPFLPDLFISLMGIFIILQIIYNKNYYLIKNKFSLFFLIFYILIILSSLFSIKPLFSFESSLFYFRYLFFVIAIYFLLNHHQKLDLVFLISSSFFFLIICIDGLYEILFGNNLFGNSATNVQGRLVGLFGEELVIGSFLVRLLPILFSIYLFNLNQLKFGYKIILPIIFIFSSIIILFSGERAAFLLLTLMILMIVLHNFIYFRSLIKLIIILPIILILGISPFKFEDSNNRIFQDLEKHISINPNQSQYMSLYSTAFNMFMSKPIIGHGPKIFRIECKNPNYAIGKWPCSTHPHNTYMQLLSEVGSFGFLYVFSIFLFFIYKIFSSITTQDSYIKSLAKYSIILSILVNLWPLIPTGSFFNNWICIFYFLPFGFYLYYYKDLS